MSNLLWNRVFLGSSLLGALSFAGFASIAAAETIAPNNALETEKIETISLDTGGEAQAPSSSAAMEAVGQQPLVNSSPTFDFELDSLGSGPSLDGMLGGQSPALSRRQPMVLVEPDKEPGDIDLITDDIGQVTDVNQLSDVLPTDWAFQALQALITRWGCIAGYPDGTFRGQQSATRFELAAALNACLDSAADKFATKEELEVVKKLQEEFANELAVLRGRVDQLEARTDLLEDQQFATITKLNGEAIMAFSYLGGDNVDTGNSITDDANPTLTQRTRLNLITSFTGKDRLYLRLQSSNRPVNFSGTGFPAPFGVSGTLDTRLSFDTGNTNNNFILDRLDYRFPIGDKVAVTAFANAAFHHYYATTINPYFEGFGGGKGAISFFGERNPIYRIGTVATGTTAGIGTTVNFTDKIRLDAGFLSGRSNLATETLLANGTNEGGLFSGTTSVLAQLSFTPTDKTQIGVTYIHGESRDGNIRYGVGSRNANLPFVVGGIAQALSTNSVGVEGTFTVTDNFAIGGWFGYTNASQDNSSNNADIINGALNFAFPDLGKEGAMGGLIVGVPPQTINNDIIANEDPGTTIHIEGLYQFPINKNIVITPGIIYLINPEADDSNGDIIVGVVRTTFRF